MRRILGKSAICLVLIGIFVNAAIFAVDTPEAQPIGASKDITRINSTRQADVGLLIIAHGAPMPGWNKPVLALEKQVIKLLGKDNPFKKVKVVFMEFARPSVADGVRQMEEAGCSRIIAVPLLIAPSSHSQWDIPALLGVYYDEDTVKQIVSEGGKPVRSKVPITITPTLSKSGIIPRILLDRVRKLSKNPNEEAVIILAHGEEDFHPFWCRLMREISSYICGKTGISYADWAYVGVGQEYATRAVPVILKALKHRKRVLLVGCYVSMGAKEIHDRFMRRGMHVHGIAMENPLKDKQVIPASHGLLPDERVARWIVSIAKRAIIPVGR